MGSGEEVVEIDSLEKELLTGVECEDGPILYSATFRENEDSFVKYQTAQWVMYSLLLMLAWGIGLFMLLYLPVRRFILRKDIQSRKLYLTPNAIMYKVVKSVAFPCLGVLKKEKHVLLASVADVRDRARRPPIDDVQIQGIANPNAFRKAVFTRLSSLRNEAFSRQVSTLEDVPNLRLGPSSTSWMSPSKSLKFDSGPQSGEQLLLQKLDEVGTSVKGVQTLLEEQRSQASEALEYCKFSDLMSQGSFMLVSVGRKNQCFEPK